MSRDSSPVAVRTWIEKRPAWLEVRSPQGTPDRRLSVLGAGERYAILLALEVGASRVILDDAEGRREAGERHLVFIGTLGVLAAASDSGLVDFDKALERLRQTNFRASPAVIEQVRKGLRQS